MVRSAVVFDLDDTLYPERQFVQGGLAAAADLLAARYASAASAARIFSQVLVTEGPFRVFDRSLEIMGIARTDSLVAELVTAYRSHSPRTSPFPGMTALINDLRNRGIRTGLVTDGYVEVQTAKWKSLGIQALFDAVVFCGDIDGKAFPKPAPEPFMRVRDLLGSPDCLVYVGDNPQRDFPAPDSMGFGTVRMKWPETWHRNDPDVRERPAAESAEQLRAVLDTILAGDCGKLIPAAPGR